MKMMTKIIAIAIFLIALWQIILIEETYRIGGYLDEQFVIVHRGDTIERPEQTFAAYEYAYENGVRIMECDARITNDGVFVAIHDSTWDRTTNGSGAVDSSDWIGYGEWLDAGSYYSHEYRNETIPMMSELFDWIHHRDIILWVDCYFSAQFDDEFIDLIDEHDMGSRVVVQFVVETQDFRRASTYDGFEICYRVAVPQLDFVMNGIDICKRDSVQYLTIDWGMGQDVVYRKANDQGVKIILYAYNQYKSNSEYLQEFQEGAWGCFSDSSTQASYIQKIIDGW